MVCAYLNKYVYLIMYVHWSMRIFWAHFHRLQTRSLCLETRGAPPCYSWLPIRPGRQAWASYISLGLVHVTLFLFLFVAHLAFSLISCITWFIRQESFFPDSLAMGTHFQECFWVSIRPWVRGQWGWRPLCNESSKYTILVYMYKMGVLHVCN